MSKHRKTAATTGSTQKRGRTIIYGIAALLALAGLADATYLTVQAFTGETAICGGATDCFKVLGSSYARIGGLPVASFGMIAYFAAFSAAILAAFNYSGAARFYGWITVAMLIATLWFLFVQAFLLHAFCRYCLFSAAVTFLLAGIAVARPIDNAIVKLPK